jgi:hypothetical protein
MPGAPNYGSVTKAELLEMIEAGLSGAEISKVAGLSKNKIQRLAKSLGVCTKGSQTMRERKLIKRGAYFVRENHRAFTSWSLASRSGRFVLDQKYMNAMHKFGLFAEVERAWTGRINQSGRLVCGPRP